VVLLERKKMDEEATLLPIVKLYNKEYLVDVKKRQFRNFHNPEDVIWMHSLKGRQMVRDMQDTKWESYGVSTGATNKAEV
jgi:hypothetical protein